jgi:hypothetical protein
MSEVKQGDKDDARGSQGERRFSPYTPTECFTTSRSFFLIKVFREVSRANCFKDFRTSLFKIKILGNTLKQWFILNLYKFIRLKTNKVLKY